MEKNSTRMFFQFDFWKKFPVIDCMDVFLTQSQIIGLWPSRSCLAKDLGVSVYRVHKWATDLHAIPSVFFLPMLSAARSRKLCLTAEDLVAAIPAKRGAA
jgi:hypothetical protein